MFWRKAQPKFCRKQEVTLTLGRRRRRRWARWINHGIYSQSRIVYTAQRVEEAPNGGQRNTNL